MNRIANFFRRNSHADEIRDTQPTGQVSNVPKDSLDCGITGWGWCNSPGCQRLGNSNTFLAVFVIAGLLQGAVGTYFRISAKQVALQYDFDPNVIDWLLVFSGLTQGVFAIFIAYWGNRIHRIAWLGGILMLQACFCAMAIIPTLTNKDIGPIEMYKITDLCFEVIAGRLDSEKSHAITTQILLFIVQFSIGLGNVAFYCLGVSYLDDNLKEHESPAYIGGAISANLWGTQIGSAIALLVEGVKIGWWFGWTIITPLVFTCGLLLALFPRRLIKTPIQLASSRLLGSVTNAQQPMSPFHYLADIGFFPSIRRLISNKILMFNVIGFMLLQTAIINFQAQEESYLQSRFFLPTSEADGLSDEWTSRLITYMLTPPLVGLSVLVAGLIIAKINPSPRKLAGWNLITSGIVAGLFFAYIFLKCQSTQIAGSAGGRLTQPFCSAQCLCKNSQFSPVCPIGSSQTYYSPCHAGCKEEKTLNNIKIFTDCTCGIDAFVPSQNVTATEGACNNNQCQKFWITFQALNAIGAALLASGLIGNLIITIRSVLPQDKSIALSFELCAIGLFAYIPGKVSYDAVARSTCALWSSGPAQKVCRLQDSPTYGNIIDILTASLILLSMLFDALVYYYVEFLPIYGDDDYYNDLSDGMHLVNRARMMIPTAPAQEVEQQQQTTTDPLLTEEAPQQEQVITNEPTSPVPSSLLSGSLHSNPSSQRSSIQPREGPQTKYAQILRTAPMAKAIRDNRLSRTLPEQTSEEIETPHFDSQIAQASSPMYYEPNTTDSRNSVEFSEEPPEVVESPSRSFKERLMNEPLQRPPNLNLEAAKEDTSQNLSPLTPVTRMRYDLKSQRPLSPETDF